MNMKRFFLLALGAILTTTVISADEGTFNSLYELGLSEVKAGNLEGAKLLFESALTAMPENPEGKRMLKETNERLEATLAEEVKPPEPSASSTLPKKLRYAKKRRRKTTAAIRVGYGKLPGIDTLEFEDTRPVIAGEGRQFDLTFTGHVWRNEHSSIGCVWGASLSHSEYEGGSWPVELNVEVLGSVFQIGPCFRIGDHLFLEVSPFVGIGSSDQSLTWSGGKEDASGSFSCYGIKAGIFILIENVELGVESGYYSFSSEAEAEGSSSDVIFSGSGMRLSAQIGIRF